GLGNKEVQALAWDGTNLYAGTREETGVTGGVYKWNGSTWSSINGNQVIGLPSQPARRVQALAIDTRPALPVIYAGTQGAAVYKTTDGGNTWTQLITGFSSSCLKSPEVLSLVVDLTQATETLYAGATEGSWTSSCAPSTPPNGHQGLGAGFFRYVAGQGWDRRMKGDFEPLLPGTLSTQVWTIVMNGSVIYVGTDIGVFRSLDFSGSWDMMPRCPTNPCNTSAVAATGLFSLPVRALGLDPTSNVTLYAGTIGRGMFKRAPPNNAASTGLQTWSAINTGLTALRAQAVAVGSRGQAEAVLAGLVSGGIVTSQDIFTVAGNA